jgi:hypothetical protein
MRAGRTPNIAEARLFPSRGAAVAFIRRLKERSGEHRFIAELPNGTAIVFHPAGCKSGRTYLAKEKA